MSWKTRTEVWSRISSCCNVLWDKYSTSWCCHVLWNTLLTAPQVLRRSCGAEASLTFGCTFSYLFTECKTPWPMYIDDVILVVTVESCTWKVSLLNSHYTSLSRHVCCQNWENSKSHTIYCNSVSYQNTKYQIQFLVRNLIMGLGVMPFPVIISQKKCCCTVDSVTAICFGLQTFFFLFTLLCHIFPCCS